MAGFRTFNREGAAQNAGINKTFAVAASHSTLLAPGDVVVITGTSNAEGVQEVDTGNATTANTGILTSVEIQYEGENLTETGLPASKAGKVRVQIDPGMYFDVAADATVTAAQVGLNVGINNTAATKTGGLTTSNMTIDVATAAATSTLPYRIEALLPDENGVLGNRVLVTPNATTSRPGATGV